LNLLGEGRNNSLQTESCAGGEAVLNTWKMMDKVQNGGGLKILAVLNPMELVYQHIDIPPGGAQTLR
jgi:hypothetical protein